MKLLHIKVSPDFSGSLSRKASTYLVGRIESKISGLVETVLDLADNPLPHLDAPTINAFFTRPEARTIEQYELVTASDVLVDMLIDTDMLVISSPMWNLGLPSVLKAWFDHITRAGRTFAFRNDGSKVGLVDNKKVYVVVSSGSPFSNGSSINDDQFTPYIRVALDYIGITDVHFIRVDGTKHPLTSQTAFTNAINYIDQII